MISENSCYYDILGVARDADFLTLKRAYFRCAKECHPDLFQNSPAKTREFQILVAAFDVLSDPDKRRRYDLRFNLLSEQEAAVARREQEIEQRNGSIMDTMADDILEELIVGNTIPKKSSLQTLFRDLARTEIFITFRDGKNLYHRRQYQAAKPVLLNAVALSPHNILYRVFLARCLCELHEYRSAIYHYEQAIAIGDRRVPPQQLYRVRRELTEASRKHHPILTLLRKFFATPEPEFIEESDTAMIEEVNRELARLAQQSNRKRLK